MKLPIVVVSLIFVLCHAEDEVTERPCNIAYKCSLEDMPTWSTDGKKCYVYRNPCHLATENCQRQNRYEAVLEVIPKEECQKLCIPRCPKIKKPVCGYYNQRKREFVNRCLMDNYICSTGETYMLYNEGRCEEPLTLTTN